MNIYYICSCQYDNLGDLVINKMLVEELSRYGVVYVDFYSSPEEFKKYIISNSNVVDIATAFNFSLQSIHISSFIKLYSFIKRHKIMLLTHSPGPRINSSFKARVFNMVLNIILVLCGAKHVYIGNCFSAALFKGIKLPRTVFPVYYLRSNESVAYAKAFFPPQKVNYIPDMCFLLSEHNERHNFEKTVAFDFRPESSNWATTLNDCKTLASYFIKSGYKVVLYYQVQSDKEFVERLYQEIESSDVIYKRRIVWYDDLSFYKSVSAVVSNRLHSLLLAGAFGAYPIGVISENEKTIKIKHVFESAFSGRDPLIFDVQQLVKTDIDDIIKNHRASIINEYDQNTVLCRQTIHELIRESFV